MKTWVVTGGAASGKSAFCQILLDLEPAAVLYSSDQAVRQLYEEEEVLAELVVLFGPEALDETKKVNRNRLRERILASETEREKLEALLHPLAFEKLSTLRRHLLEEGKTQLLIAEIPLFYETGREFPADLVILVAASPIVQQQRMMANRGLTAAESMRFLDAQLPLASKLNLAGKVVWNEGDITILQKQAELLLH